MDSKPKSRSIRMGAATFSPTAKNATLGIMTNDAYAEYRN
jgi:hypothetical protein